MKKRISKFAFRGIWYTALVIASTIHAIDGWFLRHAKEGYEKVYKQ